MLILIGLHFQKKNKKKTHTHFVYLINCSRLHENTVSVFLDMEYQILKIHVFKIYIFSEERMCLNYHMRYVFIPIEQ